jgi:glycine/D-amino acid oxidase-like deaminating enzyme
MELRSIQQPQRLRAAPGLFRDLLLSATPSVWDAAAGASYPVLEGKHAADACVIGLGGSGLACIDECLRAGISVVGVDAGRVGGAAAGRNGGLLRAGGSLFHHEARARYGSERASRIYAATVRERERIIRSLHRSAAVQRPAHDAEERDCRRPALRDDDSGRLVCGPLGRAAF